MSADVEERFLREKFCAETLNFIQRELFLRRTVFVLHFCCAN